ncbi:TPA: hypothetical protein EYN98_31175 [Candidatus Poribacteria bacterium]|jgi:hypothetical protein|nr:hypothetical protein [Candidatus Poribacteria bacterium]HIA70429.1 hypothetical protein [Candidatus Poribacteria bacterium]HIB87439.1 hypothetical protein [Candidatus Poribacteria bacterium]HIC03250.1 hypothetical protein [Candidatus Poribacteria bacterium]HIN31763.1 hypothetical protein [Candidatus Poribacteria bacterium]
MNTLTQLLLYTVISLLSIRVMDTLIKNLSRKMSGYQMEAYNTVGIVKWIQHQQLRIYRIVPISILLFVSGSLLCLSTVIGLSQQNLNVGIALLIASILNLFIEL